ncbi:hypothetical protein B0T14DRAFT_564046 [Immersiella caudata]|uniref:Uncharacterized protein n=1 Tax=Immersiella caudata TaxID=314043 RepID=A0AA39WVW3_9PEZI|nr:hypothetical protein B0T14DRAFT_564046 [Immersiella caudata]
MRLFAIITVLASLASAMPEPVAEPAVAEAETLDKRACTYSGGQAAWTSVAQVPVAIATFTAATPM